MLNMPDIGISSSSDVSINQVENEIVNEPLPVHKDTRLVDNNDLPKFTPRFLQRFELSLNDSEVKKFEELFAAKKFYIDNPPHLAWLVLNHV